MVNYRNLIEDQITSERFELADMQDMLKTAYYNADITKDDYEYLSDLLAEHYKPENALPNMATRMEAVEAQLLEVRKAVGLVKDEKWPLVTGEKFTSSADAKHTGDRVAMKKNGEATVRHYFCRLNDKYEKKGTLYTPLGNAASWQEVSLSATDEEIEAMVKAVRDKFPDFHGWVNYPGTSTNGSAEN